MAYIPSITKTTYRANLSFQDVAFSLTQPWIFGAFLVVCLIKFLLWNRTIWITLTLFFQLICRKNTCLILALIFYSVFCMHRNPGWSKNINTYFLPLMQQMWIKIQAWVCITYLNTLFFSMYYAEKTVNLSASKWKQAKQNKSSNASDSAELGQFVPFYA